MNIEEFRGQCHCAEHRGQKRLSALHVKAETDADADILEFLLRVLRDTEKRGAMEASAQRARVFLRQLEAMNN